jgi:low affinity Fe/Cu permease
MVIKKGNQKNGQVEPVIRRQRSFLEKISRTIPNWIGTTQSLVVHTVAFIAIFGLRFLGLGVNDILLILTTAVSLEAIYLSIFIQITVNQQSRSIANLQEDVEELSEDVEDIQEDIEYIEDIHDPKATHKKLQDYLLDPLKKTGLI